MRALHIGSFGPRFETRHCRKASFEPIASLSRRPYGRLATQPFARASSAPRRALVVVARHRTAFIAPRGGIIDSIPAFVRSRQLAQARRLESVPRTGRRPRAKPAGTDSTFADFRSRRRISVVRRGRSARAILHRSISAVRCILLHPSASMRGA